MKQAVVDRDTAFSAASGALMGVRGVPPTIALLLTVGLEAAFQLAAHVDPDNPVTGPPNRTLGKSALDVGASLAAWWLATRVVHPHLLLPAGQAR